MTPTERKLLLACAGRIISILARLQSSATSGHEAMMVAREAGEILDLLGRIEIDAHGTRVIREGQAEHGT
jgi:hypothetical protein